MKQPPVAHNERLNIAIYIICRSNLFPGKKAKGTGR